MVTEWILMVDYVPTDGAASWFYSCAENQTLRQSLTLVDWLARFMDHQAAIYFDEIENDGEEE